MEAKITEALPQGRESAEVRKGLFNTAHRQGRWVMTLAAADYCCPVITKPIAGNPGKKQ